jgi:hypothetical protein
MRANVFRCSPNNGHRQDTSACPFRADIVAKVENRRPDNLAKVDFGRSCCRKALWRQYEGRSSFLV